MTVENPRTKKTLTLHSPSSVYKTKLCPTRINQHKQTPKTNYKKNSAPNSLSLFKKSLSKLCFRISNLRNSEQKMGIISQQSQVSVDESHYGTHKIFLFCNYILLGAASSCIFLTLSLRLLPSLCGFLVILLHATTIAGAVSGCAAASCGRNRWYAAHMVATTLTAIFQGSVSVLIFTNTSNFLGSLKSYVREEDAAVILKLAGGLCVLIFCLEWIVLVLAFFLKYYAYVDAGNGGGNVAMRRTAKVQQEENLKDWPWPFQV